MVAQDEFILQRDLIGSSYFSFTSGFLQRRRLRSMFFSLQRAPNSKFVTYAAYVAR